MRAKTTYVSKQTILCFKFIAFLALPNYKKKKHDLYRTVFDLAIKLTHVPRVVGVANIEFFFCSKHCFYRIFMR